MPVRRELQGRLTKAQRIRRRIQDTLVALGFAEAYTWSLLPGGPVPGAIRLPEPLSSEQAVLRTALADGLIASAERNIDAGNEDIALFELAHVYLPSGGELPDERWHVAGIAEGGFARAKGVVERLYEALHVPASFERAAYLRYPGAGATVPEGWVLELADERLAGEWGLFELDVDALIGRVPDPRDVRGRHHVSSRQAGSRVRGGRDGDGGRARRCRTSCRPEQEMEAFDVYRGEQAGEGRKSIAFRVSFQSAERTLRRGRPRFASASCPRSRRSSTPSCAPRCKAANPVSRAPRSNQV